MLRRAAALASPPRRHSHQSQLPPPPRHRRSRSSALVDQSVAAAAALVQRWHPAATTCSLFLDAADGEEEARRFLCAAADLHRAMLFFASDLTNSISTSSSSSSHSVSHGLVQAQALLQTAMRRLDLELRLLLDQHRHDIGSLRAVADAMVAAGYGKECISTFKSCRRAALAAKIMAAGCAWLPNNNYSSFHKLSWEQVDSSILPAWLADAPVAFSSLFPAEKDLCDAVFDAAVSQAVLAGIAGEQAGSMLGVAEAAVARARRAPERLFRLLDVHDALAEALPALLSVFGDSSEVATRAARVVARVAEAARATLGSFEAAIRKEPSSNKATAAGGAVHPLTRYVMNYLVFLADYDDALARIFRDDDGGSGQQLVFLVRVLLDKLDAKAGAYKEAPLSYLFLANNTHYVASKACGSSRLRAALGEGWAEAHAVKARGHADVFVRAAWGKAIAAISAADQGVEEALLEAAAMQEHWVPADEEMGKVLRAAATAAVVPKYRIFYRRHGAAVRLTPGDVAAMIAALYRPPPAPS